MKEHQHAATGCGVGSSPAHSACFGVSPDRTTAGFPPIAIERTNETGLRHTERAISMARSQPDSATSGWFICINDQPSLDFGGARNPDGQGFAAFGHVVQGMDVVRKIGSTPTREGERPRTDVVIRSITIERR